MMAKKKKDSKKKETKKKIKEVEESDLEEDIEEIEERIEDTEFKEFLQPINIPAPVLKKIETSPESLELNLASSPITQTKETGINYMAGNETQNESKYSEANTINNSDETKYENEFKAQMLGQTEPERFGEEILINPGEISMQRTQNPNKIETRTLKQKRREPFETEEEKYKKVIFH